MSHDMLWYSTSWYKIVYFVMLHTLWHTLWHEIMPFDVPWCYDILCDDIVVYVVMLFGIWCVIILWYDIWYDIWCVITSWYDML